MMDGHGHSSARTKAGASSRGHRVNKGSEDYETTACSVCRFYYKEGMRKCGICGRQETLREPLVGAHACPLCSQSAEGIGAGLPIPQRVRTAIRCRGSGLRMGSGDCQPMALPNGQVYCKKFIFDNSFVLAADADAEAVLAAEGSKGDLSNSNATEDDDNDSVVSVNSRSDSQTMSSQRKYELLTATHWSDLSKVYFSCPISGDNFSLDTIRQVFIT